jgi:Tol biopolymer transport system component
LGFPGPVRHVVRRCLEKSPGDRFSSAHDLAIALEAAATDTSAGRTIPEIARRRAPVGILLATAAAVVVVLVAWGVWFARNTGPAPIPNFHPRRVAGQLGAVSEPALSPSGNEIAYTASGRGTSDIWVTDVRGGKPIRLTDMSSFAFDPTWFPDGSAVAFSSNSGAETSIWKVPRFGGTAMLLVPNAQDVAISPGGERIAFARPGKDGFLRIWTMAFAAPERGRELGGEEAGHYNHRYPAWSPDGRTICYEDVRDLWLVPADGGTPRPFTHDDARDSQPVWSTDGRYIYFASDREGTRSLWRKAVAGGAPIRVTHGAGPEDSPSLSRDGRRLAFLSSLETSTIALFDLQKQQLSRLEEGRVSECPAFAPDKSAIAFVSTLMGSLDLWVNRLQGAVPIGEPTRLTDQPGTCTAPAFSPDGRWIAYSRVIEGRREVWVVSVQGGTPMNFTNDPSANNQPAWSPDGRQIAFVSNRGGSYQVWVAPFGEGHRAGEPRRVTHEAGGPLMPCWSPDGKAIAYVMWSDKGSDVRVAPVDGSGASRGVTLGAQAYKVRWWWSRNVLVVSGYFGEALPSIRLVAPGGGEAEPLAMPPAAVLDPDNPDFDVSRDGTLLALFQATRQTELWVLESEGDVF